MLIIANIYRFILLLHQTSIKTKKYYHIDNTKLVYVII